MLPEIGRTSREQLQVREGSRFKSMRILQSWAMIDPRTPSTTGMQFALRDDREQFSVRSAEACNASGTRSRFLHRRRHYG